MELRFSHSIASAESAAEFVTAHWAVGSTRTSHLMRSYANDVYRVETESGSFMLKCTDEVGGLDRMHIGKRSFVHTLLALESPLPNRWLGVTVCGSNAGTLRRANGLRC